MKRILILYRELAGYFVECVNHLCLSFDVRADIIAYPVNPDAPFKFVFAPTISVIDRTKITESTITNMMLTNRYDLIFCGGWSDKVYLAALKKKKCISLLGFDNQWNGSFKHLLSAVYGRFMIKPLFEYAFVPGKRQVEFAQHLGFPSTKIISKAYSADVNKYSKLHSIRRALAVSEKKRLIYAGRYADEKFIEPLCKIINAMDVQSLAGWELHCIGTGPLYEKRIEGNHIFHHGFMQPDALYELMKTGDAFILPSTFEPWGVVVHEFASAGYPLLLSDAVGSAELFLRDGENGYIFPSGNEKELELALLKLFQRTAEELRTMGDHSAELARQITPHTWSQSLYTIM